jgi:hypothetical protein
MTPEVEAAIAEIKEAFPGSEIEVISEPQGGAYVVVQNLAIGERFIPSTTWVGFLITFQYPDADVYPHFIRGDLKRADGQSFPSGISGPTTWQNRPAMQVSRRSNHWAAGVDTAASKLAKVLSWLRTV